MITDVYICNILNVYICNTTPRLTKDDPMNVRYSDIKFSQIIGRHIPPYIINSALNKFTDIGEIDVVGSSVLGKSISSFTMGTGNFKILGWSQMHGNESTTTKALLDLINTFKVFKDDNWVKDLLSNITLKVILQLNPDGAEAYTRFNANDVDLNRDAQQLTQPESRTLRKVYDDFTPDVCLNLHDQRTIYNVKDTEKSATVSFLAPSADIGRSLTPSRTRAMQLIAVMTQRLQQDIPGCIGRYDDGFNSNCVGDLFQSLGTPTMLFEAGHYPKDYAREKTREYIFKALLALVQNCHNMQFEAHSIQKYLDIPENDKMYADILIKKAKINDAISDVLIQYEEQLVGGKFTFVPFILKIGHLPNYIGHRLVVAGDAILQANDGEDISEGLKIEVLKLGGVVLNFLKYS